MEHNELPDFLTGAGGGGSSEPVRTPDSLLSQDYFEMVLALCEGPILGIVSDYVPPRMEKFYAGGTPLQNASTGEPNFSDFAAVIYRGSGTETPITLRLGGASANQTVNVTLAQNVPVVRQTGSAQRGDFDQIEVRLHFSYLAKTNPSGSYETTAEFQIEYKAAASGTWLLMDNTTPLTITGKTVSGYAREFVIEVPIINDDYDIRITKLSPDGVQGVDDDVVVMSWESFQTVKRGTVSHPELALVHIHGKASNQFSSVPEMSGVFDGLIVRVPSNYNPVTRVYDEAVPWNGVFKQEYTNCGVWLLYELITNTRFGLARYYPGITADRYSFYEEAKWVDELVSNGQAGTQPRFTFNELLLDARSGWDLLQYVAGSFNGILIDDGNGSVTLHTDRPRTPVQMFTPENVSADLFSYSFSDTDSRHNDITATFINPDLDWEQDRRAATIDNTAAVAKNGRVALDFVAVGCTDAHEAVRRANYRFITANNEIATVVFMTNRVGLMARPFDVIYVADPDADWSETGRIKSVAGSVIHLRDPIFFPDTAARTIKVQGVGSLSSLTVVPPASGSVYSLTITAGSLPSPLPEKSVFSVEDGATLGIAKPFRVLTIEEIEGSPDKIQITALEVAENKYTQAENGAVYTPSQYAFTLPGQPTLPLALNLSLPPPTFEANGTVNMSIEADWLMPPYASTIRYEIDFRFEGEPAWSTIVSYNERALITNVRDDITYYIRLYAVSPSGQRSARMIESSIAVPPKPKVPPNVLGFAGAKGVGAVLWSWDALDVGYPILTEIRATNANWGNITTHPPLFRGNVTEWFEQVLGPANYTRYAKHFSVVSVYSAAAVSASVSVVPADMVPPTITTSAVPSSIVVQADAAGTVTDDYSATSTTLSILVNGSETVGAWSLSGGSTTPGFTWAITGSLFELTAAPDGFTVADIKIDATHATYPGQIIWVTVTQQRASAGVSGPTMRTLPRSVTIAAAPNGVVSSFAGGTAQITVADAAGADITSGYTITKQDVGLVATLSGVTPKVLQVTGFDPALTNNAHGYTVFRADFNGNATDSSLEGGSPEFTGTFVTHSASGGPYTGTGYAKFDGVGYGGWAGGLRYPPREKLLNYGVSVLVSGWVYLEAIPNTMYTIASNGIFDLQVFGEFWSQTNTKIKLHGRIFLYRDRTRTSVDVTATGPAFVPTINDWHHYAMSYSIVTRKLYLFFDGVKVAESAAVSGTELLIDGNFYDYTATIGGSKMSVGCWGDGTFGLKGRISQFSMQLGGTVPVADFTLAAAPAVAATIPPAAYSIVTADDGVGSVLQDRFDLYVAVATAKSQQIVPSRATGIIQTDWNNVPTGFADAHCTFKLLEDGVDITAQSYFTVEPIGQSNAIFYTLSGTTMTITGAETSGGTSPFKIRVFMGKIGQRAVPIFEYLIYKQKAVQPVVVASASPSPVIVSADWTGTVDAGQLPRSIVAVATEGATVYTGNYSWSVSASSGLTASNSGGSPTISLTAVNSGTASGNLVITGTRSGWSGISVTVAVSKIMAPQPIVTPTGPSLLTVVADTAGTAPSASFPVAGSVTAMQGATDVTSSYAWSVSASAGITASITTQSTATAQISAMTQGTDSGTLTWTGTRTNWPNLTWTVTVSKSKSLAIAGDVQFGNIYNYVYAFSGSAKARFIFEQDGRIFSGRNTGTLNVYEARYYNPDDGGIGASRWLKLTKLSGTDPNSPSLGTLYALTAGVTIELIRTSAGAASTQLKAEIYSDSGGVTKVSEGILYLEAEFNT